MKDSETFLFLNLGDLAKPTSTALVVPDFFLEQYAVVIVAENHITFHPSPKCFLTQASAAAQPALPPGLPGHRSSSGLYSPVSAQVRQISDTGGGNNPAGRGPHMDN